MGLFVAVWCASIIGLSLILADEHGRELDVTTGTLTPEPTHEATARGTEHPTAREEPTC